MEGHAYIERMSGDWTADEMAIFARLLSVPPSSGRKTMLPAVWGFSADVLERLSAVTLSVRSATGTARISTALLEWGVEAGEMWINLPKAADIVFLRLGADPQFFLKQRFRGGRAGHSARLYTLLLSAKRHGDLRLTPEDAMEIFGKRPNTADFRRFVLDVAFSEITRSGVEVPGCVEARRDMRRKGAPLRHWLVAALGVPQEREGRADELALSTEGILDISRVVGVSPSEVSELWQLAIASAREAAAGGSVDDAAMLMRAAAAPDKTALAFFQDL